MAKLPDHVGIDFGTHSVKAVEISGADTPTPSLVNLGSQRTPVGVINSEDEKHQQLLADALKTLYANSRIRNKNIVLALPENSVFTRHMEFNGLKEEELPTAVYYEARQYLSVPPEDLNMNYLILAKDEERANIKVLLVAATKKIINIYEQVVKKAGLNTIAIETESVALGRAMYRAVNEKQLVMLDFGANTTDMSILQDGNLAFSQSIAIGSDALTQAISSQYNLDYNQAEEYKKTYGIQPDAIEGKLFNTLKPIVDSILTEVSRGLEFYKSKTLSLSPTKYLLNGDGALLPGLAQYVSSSLSVDAVIADPWVKIRIPDRFNTIIMKNKPSYSVAVGLALKTGD